MVATEATAGSAAPNDVRIEAVPATQQISGALPDDNGTTMARESDAVVAAPQPSSVDGDMGFASPEIAPERRAAERPRRSRWPMAGVLSAIVLAAVAVYVYRTELSSQQPREATYATQTPAVAPERIPAKIDVPAAIATTAEPIAAAPTAPPTATAELAVVTQPPRRRQRRNPRPARRQRQRRQRKRRRRRLRPRRLPRHPRPRQRRCRRPLNNRAGTTADHQTAAREAKPRL